jgi:hypothetical protein
MLTSMQAVESRHGSYLRTQASKDPFAPPVDVPLSPSVVFSLAHDYILDCPSRHPLISVKAFPRLVARPDGLTPVPGSLVTVETDGHALRPERSGAQVHAAFLSANGPIWTQVRETSEGNGTRFNVTIPEGVQGQRYVVLSDGNRGAVFDEAIIAGPALIEVTLEP